MFFSYKYKTKLDRKLFGMMNEWKNNTTYYSLFAAALIFTGAVLFSAKAIMVKLAYRFEIDSVSLLALRMLFALPFFLLIAFFNNRNSNKSDKPISNKDWFLIFLMGSAGYYLASLFDFIGLQYITASLERLVLFMYPTLVVLINALFFKKKIKKIHLIALLLTYIGIGLAFWQENMFGRNEDLVLGASMIFISALTYAIYLVGSGEILPRVGTVRFTSYAMTVSALMILIHHAITNGLDLFGFDIGVYKLAILMATFATVIPSFLVSEGIRIIGSNKAAIIGSIGPISTIILANIFLDEQFGSLQIIGTMLVIVGVLLISLNKDGK